MLKYFNTENRARRRLRRACHDVRIAEDYHTFPQRSPVSRRLEKITLLVHDVETLERSGTRRAPVILFNAQWVLRNSHREVVAEVFRAAT